MVDRTGVHIRDFAAADSEAVNRIALAAFSQYADKYDDWQEFSGRIADMASMADRAEIVVAECGTAVCGAVAYVRPDQPKPAYLPVKDASIRMLVVDPASRGLGIGRALTDECLARAHRDGCRGISLHTSKIMTVALAMYLRLGFAESAGSDEFTINGVPYRVYRKVLQ